MILAEQVSMVFHGKEQVVALDSVDLRVDRHEFVSLIGPSGCGKTTFLHIVAGLVQPTSGRVSLNGKVITGPGADRGMVFQESSLYPWLTVKDNVVFGLRLASNTRFSKEEGEARVADLLKMVGLDGFSKARPDQLSGGMKQRVALAAALAPDPEVLLMDEPFGALDSQTRGVMQRELLRIHEATKKTGLLVTHDIREAVLLSDRVVVVTARPGTVKAILDINLPRPRFGRKQEYATAFLDLCARIDGLLEEEIDRAMSVGA